MQKAVCGQSLLRTSSRELDFVAAPVASSTRVPRVKASVQACALQPKVCRACLHQRVVPAPIATASGRCTPCSRKQVVVKAGWGAPVDFTPAKVVSNKVVAPGMHILLVDVGGPVSASYTKPGQYIQAKTASDPKPGFFAVASPPDANNQGVVELLIKIKEGTAGETICGLKEGDELLVSPAQGKGFPVDQIPAADYPTVLMFATGTGISPIKAVIESGVLDIANRKEVKLYYGTKSEDDTAYQALIPSWAKQGIDIIQVFSGDKQKYVQAAFAGDVSSLTSPGQVGVLLCGQKGMCDEVTELAKKQGVEQILMNF